MHCFLYFYYPYIAILGDLAPQVELLSSVRMTTLLPIQQPYIRDLMASIKVIGKLSSGVIRPFCITILYHNLLLFIDIFHI
jgi:hypothetical protein